MNKKKIKKTLKKTWHFIWEEDSIASWIVNIILAFIIIKFLVYPGLGLLVGTNYPIVAVVSGSMEHNLPFDTWWEENKNFYIAYNITKEDFEKYSFKNGFNRGDIMILRGINPKEVELGNVIVFDGFRSDPIIHRTIKKWYGNTRYHFTTKGDNNPGISYLPPPNGIREDNIEEDRVIGKAIFKVPFLGYIKIWFMDLVNLIKGVLVPS